METGIRGEYLFTVSEEQLAINVGSGSVRVLATPVLVMAVEHACAQSVQGELPEGKTTVGTLVNLTHSAPTPLGMKVRVESELVHVSANGKMLDFKARIYDEKQLVGEAEHQRAIITKERFQAKADAKKD